MKPKKIQTWPFILLSALLFLCALFTAWLFHWWGWTSPGQILLIGAAASTTAGILSGLCYWLVTLTKAPVISADALAERETILSIERAITAHFTHANSSSRLHGDRYKTPWYLLFSDNREYSHDLLVSQGLEKIDLEHANKNSLGPVSFWKSDKMTVVCFEQYDSPYFQETVTWLLTLFGKHRSRQGVNGALLALSTECLIHQQQSQLNERATNWRNLLRRCNSAMGLDLPCYAIVTDLSALSDIQRLFSCFDDDRLEQPLGALTPTPMDGFDEQWFEQSFRKIEEQLLEHTTRGLKSQLNQQYRASILMGPYQFSLLKIEFRGFLRQLFSDADFSGKQLNFRGYLFSNINAKANSIDKLSMLLSVRLGYHQGFKSEPEFGKALFSNGLFDSAILPESGLVGVNRKRERRYRLLGWGYRIVLLSSFIAVAVLLKDNYVYYNQLNTKAQMQLVEYRENMLADHAKLDSLTGAIFILSDLREIREIYSVDKPWYIFSALPNPSIETEVRVSYKQALEGVLLVALRDYLLKDMFVYHKLDNTLKTVELYNLYGLLFDPLRVNETPLIDYYVSSLQAEGESDASTIERFRIILSDVLDLGTAPELKNQTLIDLVQGSLSQDNISQLLYQHIKERPDMSERVDLRHSLGQQAKLVFSYTADDDPYLIPKMFTREGFELLLKGDDFQLASTAMAYFEGVLGQVTSNSQISRINRELKQRYIDDYINYWERFYHSVGLHETTGILQVQHQLNLVIDPAFSPLKKFFMLIEHQTNLIALMTPPPIKDGEPLVKPSLDGLKMAQEIGRPFIDIHRLVTPSDQDITPLDTAIVQLRTTHLWLDKAFVQAIPGAYLLKQWSASGRVNPLEQMTSLAGSYNNRLIVGYLNRLSSQLNTIVMLEIRDFINDKWQQDVYAFYRHRLADFYPFDSDSLQDVSAKDFNTFFAFGGKVDLFSTHFLDYFNGGFKWKANFSNNDHLPLSSELTHFLLAVKEIQRTMYSAGALNVSFDIRAKDMSSSLSEISLHRERLIYRYRNGPPLWTSSQWPQPQQSSETIKLTLNTIDRQLLRTTFSGFWSWFKLVDAMKAHHGADLNVSEINVKEGSHSAVLVLRVKGDKSPLIAGYLSEITTPSTLWKN